jgi:hypothetical protein
MYERPDTTARNLRGQEGPAIPPTGERDNSTEGIPDASVQMSGKVASQCQE